METVKFFKISKDALLPTRQTPGSAGYDLHSIADGRVPARGKLLVPIGISVSINSDFYGKVTSRSSNSLKHSIEVGAGTIDSDYRGQIHVLLYNHSDIDWDFKKYDRIAQLIFIKISTPVPFWSEIELDQTERAEGGFGSTGR